VPPNTESDPDQNVEADVMEGFEQAVSTEGELEQRMSEVTEALKKIASGEYGVCRVCEKGIEEKRLEANPAATTCIEHLNVQ
jgi:RNA polymerase-binding transcription factor DksA